jgi:hypothetical protein
LNIFDKSEKTNELPTNIKAVSKRKNLYEKHQIEKAGYKEHDKIKTLNDSGSFTAWKHTITGEMLIFMEKADGFYQFGGYIKDE